MRNSRRDVTAPAPSAAPKKSSRAAQKSAATPQTFTDTLPASMQHQDPSAELTYAVEVLNRNARGARIVESRARLRHRDPASANRSIRPTNRRWHQCSPGPAPANHSTSRELARRATSLSNLSARRKLRQRRNCWRSSSPLRRAAPSISPTPASNGKRPISTASPR